VGSQIGLLSCTQCSATGNSINNLNGKLAVVSFGLKISRDYTRIDIVPKLLPLFATLAIGFF
jgi:hypothetical protein